MKCVEEEPDKGESTLQDICKRHDVPESHAPLVKQTIKAGFDAKREDIESLIALLIENGHGA